MPDRCKNDTKESGRRRGIYQDREWVIGSYAGRLYSPGDWGAEGISKHGGLKRGLSEILTRKKGGGGGGKVGGGGEKKFFVLLKTAGNYETEKLEIAKGRGSEKSRFRALLFGPNVGLE